MSQVQPLEWLTREEGEPPPPLEEDVSRLPPGTAVLALGDSLTAGYHLSNDGVNLAGPAQNKRVLEYLSRYGIR